jgi:hypothetical protein
VLSGLIVAVVAAWAKYAFNRLWQKSLASDASEALAYAVSLGLRVLPAGWGPTVVVEGQLDGQAIRLEWGGGLRGERTRVRVGEARESMPMLRTAADVRSALGGEE